IANSDPNSVAHLARSTPAFYFAFDLLYLNGYDLRGVPLEQRRALLEQVVTPGGPLRISAAFPGGGEEMLEAARETGLEGIIAERPKPDRGMTWVKPELVCQVKYAHWTQDQRLRAPVFLGLRNDKPAAEVAREDAKEASLNIDGHALKFTNLRKVFYPDEGYT